MSQIADGLCGICFAMLSELCLTERDPLLCEAFTDYATGQVDGSVAVEWAIRRVGWEKAQTAANRLIDRGVLGTSEEAVPGA